MERVAQRIGRFSWLAAAAAAVTLFGCPSTPPPKSPPPQPQAAPAAKPASPAAAESESKTMIPTNLGEPLVDKPDNLKRLDPEQPVWIDTAAKQIVLLGTVCSPASPLEFFATYPNRDYESVVSIYARPSIVHAALLSLGAKPGKPVEFEPKFVAPSGAEVAIDVRWKDKEGKRRQARAQDWVRDIKTKKALDANWVFAGSMFREDSDGKKSYAADTGEFITVLNLRSALLDVPIASPKTWDSREFQSFAERLPPPGTPVTLILKPKVE